MSSNNNLKQKQPDAKTLSQILLLLNKNKYNEAEKKIKNLIREYPDIFIYKNLLAIIYASQKKFKNSTILLKQIIKQAPNYIDAYVNLGNVYKSLGQLQKSEIYFKKAISIDPDNKTALSNLANIQNNKNSNHEVHKINTELPLKNTDNLEILTKHGLNFTDSGNFNKAKKIFKKILKLNPKYLPAIINLGIVYKKEENVEKAVYYFLLALKLKPNFSIAHLNLGTVFEIQEQYDKSINHYHKAIKINPTYVKAHYNLGCTLDKIGKTNEAVLSYKKALKYDPQNINAKFNLGRDLLALDDFKNGWKGYEYRYGKEIHTHYQTLNIQKEQIWNGKQFEGPLIIHGEQGIGDEILFSSIFSNLIDFHKDVSITTDERLIPILQRSFSTIKFMNRHGTLYEKKKTKHIFSGSLGKIFRNSSKSFKKNKTPWLFANKKRIEEYNNLFSDSKKIKVGLSWKAKGISVDKRSISLIDLAKIFPKKRFEIINLQYGDIKSDMKKLEDTKKRKLIFFDNLNYTNDLDGLAALICNCDLIVTIGNAVAHLAGALGKNVWTLVPTDSHWWWHYYNNKENLWYPNVKIFKQKKRDNWDYVFKILSKEVRLKYFK